MKIVAVRAEYTRTFNLRQYESLRVGMTLEAQVEDDEAPADVARALYDQAKALVKEQVLPVLKAQRANVEQIVAGLPVEAQQQMGVT